MKKEVTEINAAEALLDQFLRIHLPTPWLLRLLGKKTTSLWFRRPVYNQLLRISAAYTKMGIELVKLEEGDGLFLFSQIAEHGVTASRLVAMGLIRGSLTSWLFVRPLAWYLREHMEARGLAELTKLFVVLSTGEDFVSIIRSMAHLRVTVPMLSHKKTES